MAKLQYKMVLTVLWNYIFEFLIFWVQKIIMLQNGKISPFQGLWSTHNDFLGQKFKNVIPENCLHILYYNLAEFQVSGHFVLDFYSKTWNIRYRDLKSRDPFSTKIGPFLLNISQNGLRTRFWWFSMIHPEIRYLDHFSLYFYNINS